MTNLCVAISLEPMNIKLMWERASLYCEMRSNKRAIDSYEEILKVLLRCMDIPDLNLHSPPLQILPPDAGYEYVEITKELAAVSIYNIELLITCS